MHIKNPRAYRAKVIQNELIAQQVADEAKALVRAKLNAMKSSDAVASDHWRTPPSILAPVRRAYCSGPAFQIGLDPCSQPDNPTAAEQFFCLENGQDGLSLTWRPEVSHDLVFVNPPFSQLKLWATKIALEAEQGTRMVVVAKVSVCTDWFKVLERASGGSWLAPPTRISYLRQDGEQGTRPTFETAVFCCNLNPYKLIEQAPDWRLYINGNGKQEEANG